MIREAFRLKGLMPVSGQGATPEGDRQDFGRLFTVYRGQFPFLVGGSAGDPFERRQIDLSQERLGSVCGLQIERLPGGHLTTSEQPDALAALIAKFERGLS